MKEKIIAEWIAENKIELNELMEILYEVKRVDLSKMFGWMPDEIDNMKIDDIESYISVLRNDNSLGKSMIKWFQ
jgi:hypothetical protein